MGGWQFSVLCFIRRPRRQHAFIVIYFKAEDWSARWRRILTSLTKILFASTTMGMTVCLVFRYTSTFADTNFWGA